MWLVGVVADVTGGSFPGLRGWCRPYALPLLYAFLEERLLFFVLPLYVSRRGFGDGRTTTSGAELLRRCGADWLTGGDKAILQRRGNNHALGASRNSAQASRLCGTCSTMLSLPLGGAAILPRPLKRRHIL